MLACKYQTQHFRFQTYYLRQFPVLTQCYHFKNRGKDAIPVHVGVYHQRALLIQLLVTLRLNTTNGIMGGSAFN